jgi:FKBP-type peptidyl-prolyl cis-trans isomerase SlyD
MDFTLVLLGVNGVLVTQPRVSYIFFMHKNQGCDYNGQTYRRDKSEPGWKGIQMSTDTVQKNVVVSMEYTLHVDGEEIDSSNGQDPLQFLVGHDNIISGLEHEMMGMKVGDSKDVVIQPADAYGEFDEQAFMDVPRGEFPKDMPLEEGLELSVRDDSGQARYARVDAIDGDNVTLNFNHPLAGDELHFKVKVVGLREPTAEELSHGHVHEGGHQH